MEFLRWIYEIPNFSNKCQKASFIIIFLISQKLEEIIEIQSID